MKPETKNCQNCKQNFVIEPEDFDFYKKIDVPPPTFCSECRMIRRLAFRNERKLFRVKDAHSGKEIFSLYPAEAGAKVYENEYWWSDNWDAIDYGRDYDFSKSFFEQFKKLLWDVPWCAKSVLRVVNSEYSNNCGDFKNCYLCFNGDRAEDCMYCVSFADSKNSADCLQGDHLELCYELFSCSENYQCFWCVEVNNSHNVWFSKNCDNLSDCFGCVNLRNKQYHIFNEPHTKEAYQKKIEEFKLNTYFGLEGAKREAYSFWAKFPVKYMRSLHNQNSSGEFIYDSKNVHSSYHIGGAENVRYSFNAFNKVADCYDYCVWGDGAEELYECLTCGGNSKSLRFCNECWPSSVDMEYSMHCRSSSDCFGCVGVKSKQYCIFNKQYTKEEYFDLRAKIIKHMSDMPYKDDKGNIYKYGEFFPPSFSPMPYNETSANDYFPLTKEQAKAKGFFWLDIPPKEFKTSLDSKDLPDNVEDVNDSVCNEIISCADCKRAYRVIPQELAFYKRTRIPLPRLCPECRIQKKIESFRPHMKWYSRQCMCDYKVYENFSKHEHHPDGVCQNKFLTTYNPDDKDIVYCEVCYQKELI